jgi:hypothetical protein
MRQQWIFIFRTTGISIDAKFNSKGQRIKGAKDPKKKEVFFSHKPPLNLCPFEPLR